MTEQKFTLNDLDSAPVDVPVTNSEIPRSEYEQLSKRFIELSDKHDELAEEHRQLKAHRATSAILDELIRPFAYSTFSFMIVYCFFVAVVLLEQANGAYSHPLSDSVLEILVGSTAVTVIGLVGMVLTGVFVGARKAK